MFPLFENMQTLFFFSPFLVLLIGWLLDHIWGDPAWLPHPIVGFGRMIAIGERALNRGKGRVWKGGLMSITYIIGIFFLTVFLLQALWFIDRSAMIIGNWLYWLSLSLSILILALGVFFCLAGTTLINEVSMVFDAVEDSVESGRRQVSRIVGRDTATLSAQEVRTAALETLAENLSDGVVAPLFWYLFLGLPGMLTYKMINTLDSMIGYKTSRYNLFGRIAAKIDDVANYLPARLTAFLMILVSGRLSLFSFVRHYGSQHASPNSGYPEAALAGVLGCRFGGPHNYFGETIVKPYIGETEKKLTIENLKIAIDLNRRVEVLMLILTLLCHLCFFV